MDNYLISELVDLPESEYLDFKAQYPDNNSKFVHDIICLANAETSNDRFLILGITNGRDVQGVGEDANRLSQNQIIDLLKNSNFNTLPTVRLDKHIYQQKEVDVLCIGNRKEKPYFLLRDKADRGTVVRSGVTYTRAGDTNTSINSTADDRKIESMYRERFRIDASPIERIKLYLEDVEKWNYTDEDGVTIFHYETFPEFTISMMDSEQSFSEPWVLGFPDPSVYHYILRCKYYGTKLYEKIAVSLDGGRMLEVIPFQRAKEIARDKYRFYYFFKEGSIDYLLHEMIRVVYPQQERFHLGDPFNVFGEEENPDAEIEQHFRGTSNSQLVYFEHDEDGDYERKQS